MINNSKLKIIFIISLIFITFVGCEDDDNWIPYVRVYMSLGIYTELATLGHFQTRIYTEEGVNGIILIRLDDIKFNAYDRTCSFKPSENCPVELKDEEFFAKCPCCGSEFDLIYGDIRKGPAKSPLKQYSTVVDGNRLYISN